MKVRLHPEIIRRRVSIPSGWLAVLMLLLAAGARADAAAHWPGWRGDGSGICSGQNPPLYWSADAGIAWKTTPPGSGNSSPVVWGDRIFLTAAANAGTNRLVLCFGRHDGRLLWRTDLSAARTPPTYSKNGYASPTPVTDGQRVYAFFDSPGLVALDMEGRLLWTRDLGPFNNSDNMASSPVLCGDLVVQCCDQDGGSFIVALDKTTGAERWRTPRPGMARQWSTPLVAAFGGQTQIVVNGQTVSAYNPADGKEIWSCRGMRPNVTPSAVAAGNLVYAVSGRNGPALAVDPRGAGDVTETRVRMQIASGGPYVPSPLAFPVGLLLPGDDGRLRLIASDGRVVSELRIPGHYTASPVASGSVIYWPNEKGHVAVVRLAGEAGKPRLELVSVNAVGGACLASPAITGENLFLRTDQALLCISGATKPGTVEALELPGTVAELKQMLTDHPAPEGPDVALRIALVEKLATLPDEEGVALLRTVALKDPHWDVGEAAAKSLAAIGRPAVPALIALMGAVDWQPYLKTIAADALGSLAAAEAIPALLKAARDRNALVRVPALQALGRIAAAHAGEVGNVAPALLAGVGDPEGTVRKAALDALALNAGAWLKVADRKDIERLAGNLKAAAADRNPLVVQAAATALDRLVHEGLKSEGSAARPGEAPSNAPGMRWLRAGPVRLKFQDGELRYLQAGGREIIRRIYFAVRDERYDTVMPAFSEATVEAAADAFTIRLAATCSNDVAGFSWTGMIVGAADGTITFQVSGQADRDFKPPRIGLNVLYGATELAGQAYELVDEKGAVATGEFPRLVSAKPLSEGFRTLRYATPDGLRVSVGLVDGKFGMEDQRNFGDSSHKAYSAMPFKYMSVKAGEKGTQTLKVEVKGAPPSPAPVTPVRVTLGPVMPGTRLPKVAAASGKGIPFYEVNGKIGAQASELAWSFNAALHLPDNDTLMENIPAIADQVKSMRALAPQARIRLAPVTFNSPYPRPGPDPRLRTAFGAAWVVRMVKHLGSAGVDEAAFDFVAGEAADTLRDMAEFSGSSLLATTFAGGGIPSTVDVLAFAVGDKRRIWAVNLTDQPVAVTLAGLGAGAVFRAERSGADTPPRTASAAGEITCTLSAYEILRLASP